MDDWAALRIAGWRGLMQAESAIWADSACWTGWEVLTVLDEWKITLVLVGVERVKMAVVCRSTGTVVHLGSDERGSTIHNCCADCLPVVLIQWKAG